MSCTFTNIVAAALYALALLFVLCSFDPIRAGGVMKLIPADGMTEADLLDWGQMELLAHPTYLSFLKDPEGNDSSDDASKLQKEIWCWGTWGNDYETFPGSVGILQNNSRPCVMSILSATRAHAFGQRYYSTLMFGSFWSNTDNEWISMGKRRLPAPKYALNSVAGYERLTPNIWATQDSLFMIIQGSGCFLAFGIVCHTLAILMGGFVWNWSKKCCDFGLCAFFFNSLFWGGLSILCYIISIASFASLYFQGFENDQKDMADVAYKNRLKVKYSPGGALILASIVLQVLGYFLASWAWYKEEKEERDEQAVEAVERAIMGPAV